jgi:hypothetical protein
MRPLPIGIQTLKKIIENDMVYIDKTPMAYELAKLPGRYFLSRPRRFGKSLFLDTLKETFEGNGELFRDLYMYDKWDWKRKFPVIKLDFAGGGIRSTSLLDIYVKNMLEENAARLGVPLIGADNPIGLILENLIRDTSEKIKENTVVLVDEYDKPILDNIDDIPRAQEIKEALKDLYSAFKKQDANLQFVFLTGVSKFSKVSVFSGMNNLTDLTLHRRFATVCGYTQHDLETAFAQHLHGVDRDELRNWYNGYRFLGEAVYNPYDILLFLQGDRVFRNYWFETGTPSFLVKLIQSHEYFLPDLDSPEVGEELLGSFELESIEPITLLFQSGYLTIKESRTVMDRQVYRLEFPNREVKTAFNEYLIQGYAGISREKLQYEQSTYDALIRADLSLLESTIRRLFASIPYRNFTHFDRSNFEGYYASVLYAFFAAVNCEIVPEDITNHGQADMTIKIGDTVYVMEIKVTAETESPDNPALRQVKVRNYAQKYVGAPGSRVFEVGMIFSSKERNLIEFGWEQRFP